MIVIVNLTKTARPTLESVVYGIVIASDNQCCYTNNLSAKRDHCLLNVLISQRAEDFAHGMRSDRIVLSARGVIRKNLTASSDTRT
jgi:hypothetical protein